MGSADFSQFVVTTADGTACETSPLKVLALSPHLSAAFTGTSSNFWTSSFQADLSVFPSLLCGSCSSDQGFAYSFLQIPPHGGHPCCSAMCFVVAYAHSGLSPVRARPWRANLTYKDSPFSDNWFLSIPIYHTKVNPCILFSMLPIALHYLSYPNSRPADKSVNIKVLTFQSMLPSQGATQFIFCCRLFCRISIHAPLAGSDCKNKQITIFFYIIIYSFLLK